VDIPYSPRLALQEVLDSQPGVPTLVQAQPPTLSYERALLEEFAPPSVIVDRRERMLYIHGDTTPFLAYPAGEPTNSICARGGSPSSLRSRIRRSPCETR
jgi:hypothetical protein